MSNEYIGPGPGEWKSENPSAEELFDIDDDRIFAKNRGCQRLFCNETTAFGSDYCLEHTEDVYTFRHSLELDTR